jgi:hypothetical protein
MVEVLKRQTCLVKGHPLASMKSELQFSPKPHASKQNCGEAAKQADLVACRKLSRMRSPPEVVPPG